MTYDEWIAYIKSELARITSLVVAYKKQEESDHASDVEKLPDPVIKSRVQTWALAIQKQEGWNPGSRSYINKNPGNIKFTPYTKTLGATHADDKNFCVFPTYEAGFNALCQFLRDAASGKLKSYKPSMSLRLFTAVYAQPPNFNYVNGVAKALGVSIDISISNLL